jgi:hypothetical protein
VLSDGVGKCVKLNITKSKNESSLDYNLINIKQTVSWEIERLSFCASPKATSALKQKPGAQIAIVA